MNAERRQAYYPEHERTTKRLLLSLRPTHASERASFLSAAGCLCSLLRLAHARSGLHAVGEPPRNPKVAQPHIFSAFEQLHTLLAMYLDRSTPLRTPLPLPR